MMRGNPWFLVAVHTGMPTERPRQSARLKVKQKFWAMSSMLGKGRVARRQAASCKVDSAQVLTQSLPVHQRTLNAVPREWVLTVWGLQGRCPRKVLAQAPQLCLYLFTSLRACVRHKRIACGHGGEKIMSFGVPIGI